MDEGMTLLYPELLLDGKIPQRDFESFYPPGNVWFLAGVYAFFGAGIEVARAVGWFYQGLILAGIAALARPFGWGAVALAWVFCGAMLSLVGLTPFAWFLAMACLVWMAVAVSSDAFTRSDSLWPAIAGALAGLAVTARHDAVLAALALFVMGWIRAPVSGRARMAAGFAIALIPLGFHAVAVGWGPLWENFVEMPLHATRPERRLPLFRAEFSDRLAAISALLSLASVALALIASRVCQGDGEHGGIRRLVAAGLCAVGVLPQMFQMVDYPHVVMGGTLSVALGVTVAVWAAREGLKGFFRIAVLVMSGLACGALIASGYLFRSALAVGHAFVGIPSAYPVVCGERTFFVEYPHQAAAAQGVVDFLSEHARPGERLVCGPADLSFAPATDTFFYHLLYPVLIPGTYFLEFNPGSANRVGTRLADDVLDADWIIQNAYYRVAAELDPDTRRGDHRAQTIVETRFRPVAVFGAYRVLRRSDSAGR